MKFLKKILFIGFMFAFLGSLNSQSVRFDLNREAIGIQTPHDWNVYFHTEGRLFTYPFAPDILISVYEFQLGYKWFKAKRGAARSAINKTVWFLSPDEDKSVNHYWDIIPLAFSIYPFDREYIGLDLAVELDPNSISVTPRMAILVKLD